MLSEKEKSHQEYEICPPRLPLTISLSIDPDELELAMSTNGDSLSGAVMMAIIFALVLDEESPPTAPN